MSHGKYLSLEEARKLGKLKQFAKQHPSKETRPGRFDALLDAMIVYTPEDCIARACGCVDSLECLFERCPDCDRLVDGHGITCDPRGCCFTCKAD